MDHGLEPPFGAQGTEGAPRTQGTEGAQGTQETQMTQGTPLCPLCPLRPFVSLASLVSLRVTLCPLCSLHHFVSLGSFVCLVTCARLIQTPARPRGAPELIPKSEHIGKVNFWSVWSCPEVSWVSYNPSPAHRFPCTPMGNHGGLAGPWGLGLA